jgi:hypothetical protein
MGIKPTSEKAAEYYWFGQKCLDLETSGTRAIVDGVYTVICKFDEADAILIVLGGGNFVSVPRIFGVNDGYSGTLAPVGAGGLAYPLSSDGATTQTLTIDKDEGVSVSRDGILYGNVDWKGAYQEEDTRILTWKGPTGRSIPFDYNKPIEGLTTPDIVFGGVSTGKFTCFGADIYAGGSVAFTAIGSTPVDVAPKVLGCAYQGNTLVCIVNNHYPDKIGFFEEVWVTTSGAGLYDEKENPGGWRLLGSRIAGRPSMIWAFNQSGTKATQGVAEYSIDIETGAVLFDAGSNTNISYILDNSDPNGDHSTVYSGTTKIWSDYKGDKRVFAVVSASGGQTFTFATTTGSTKAMAPVNSLGDGKGFFSVSITANQATATSTGTFCSCTGVWSISGGGTISPSGLITPGTGCGTGTVTYSCGSLSATAQYKYGNGAWILSESYFDSRIPTDYLYSQTIGGGAADLTKIVESYGDGNILVAGSVYQRCNPDQTGCVNATSGTHSNGCLGVPAVGTSFSCTGNYSTDICGCVTSIYPWSCTCRSSRCKQTYRWGCAGDTPVASACL